MLLEIYLVRLYSVHIMPICNMNLAAIGSMGWIDAMEWGK